MCLLCVREVCCACSLRPVSELSHIQGLEKVGSEVTNAFGAQQLQGAGEGIVIFDDFRVETVRQKKRVSSEWSSYPQESMP